jgi:hypothetical protein
VWRAGGWNGVWGKRGAVPRKEGKEAGVQIEKKKKERKEKKKKKKKKKKKI